MHKIFHRFLSMILCAIILMWASLIGVPSMKILAEGNGAGDGSLGEEVPDWERMAYDAYLAACPSVQMAESTVIVSGDDYTSGEGVEKLGDGAIYTESGSSVFWEITVPESGLYHLTLKYRPTPPGDGFETAVERTLLINGEVPFQEALYLTFSRSYADEQSTGKDFAKDANGNDIRPSQQEVTEYREKTVSDPSGYVSGYLCFYLEKGKNSLGLKAVKGAMDIQSIRLSNESCLVSYTQYRQEHEALPDNAGQVEPIELRAELPVLRSDYTILPATDRSSAGTQPNDPAADLLNTIGGDKWQLAGQWLKWEFDVEQDGWYQIALRYRQNLYPGAYSTRRVYIDGTVPFEEAERVAFSYNGGWQVDALGNGEEDFRFYLEAGSHTLTMEVTLGDMAHILKLVKDILADLNEDYRAILTYTGAAPDVNRDYTFEKLIPDVIADLEAQREALEAIRDSLIAKTKSMGDNTGTLQRMAVMLGKMTDDPGTIARHFLEFKDNLAALGTWLQTYCQQPLELDTIYILPAGEELPPDNVSFFADLLFRVKAFLHTFISDYRNVGTTYTGDGNDIVTVWIATGRDQCQIVQRLADELFSPEKEIPVNLQLVAAGTLLPSILAEIGPDVYLSAASGDPINYAIRSAVVPLDRFEDLDEVKDRFHPSALVPFTFEGQTFALPETQSFPIMFYRKDILSGLNLKVPETWDEFYAMIPRFQKNQMKVGFQWQAAMNIFLYQYGGSYYNEALDRSALDTNEAMKAFKKTTDLYTKYRFDVEFNFANRFRTGEIPLGIIDYTNYNQLTIFAPEIKGLWGIAPVPGLAQEDGTINREVPSTCTAVMMMRGAKNESNSWEFMKWWTSAAAQSRFGLEMESTVGPSAKQATANLEAVSCMSWSSEELGVLKKQWESVVGIPEIPGGYYTTRALEFAFNSVYTQGVDPVTAMEDNLQMLNDEITRKRREFGLE